MPRLSKTAAVQSTPPDTSAQLAALEEVFARAAEGDFSQDIQIPANGSNLAPVFRSVQEVLKVVREKMGEAEVLHEQLAELLKERTIALERSQSFFRSVMEHAPNYIQIVDPELTVTYINRTDGMDRSKVIGRKMGSFMPPDQRRRIRRKIRNVLRTGKSVEYEYSADVGEGGKTLWYRASAGPIWGHDKITGVVTIIFDITEDRERAAALKKDKDMAENARAQDRTLLESIGEGLIVIDENGAIATANPSAAHMLGYAPDEMLGQWFPRIVRAFDESGREVEAINRPAIRSLTTGRIISEVVHYQRRDGSRFPVAVTISPVVINGKPRGSIEVFRDLTDERELEQAKEEFVSLASHQLRTPATGVKAYISMLLDGYAGKLKPQQEEFLCKVYESNERQLQIVNDMLNVARADAGRIIPELVSSDVAALARDIVDEQKPTIQQRAQQLRLEVPEGKLEATIDPKLIRMVVENLLSNASKYTREGGDIRLKLTKRGEVAVLTIADSGVGISQEDLPKLFKRFSRIDNPLSTVRGGSGLGLYLAQTIVLLHKGRLSVASELEKGTTFTVELPVHNQRPARKTALRVSA